MVSSEFDNTIATLVLLSLFFLYIFLTRLNGWLFICTGPEIIRSGYKKAKGEPLRIRTPDNLLTIVSSSKLIKDLENAPNDCLSLAAASKELFQPKYTMHGFDWPDERGVDGVGFVRVLRSLLVSHLPVLLPDLKTAISVGFDDELAAHNCFDNRICSPVLPMVEKVVTKANCVMFFGTQLSCNPEFLKAALQYTKDVFITAEIMRLTPKLLAPLVARFMISRHKAQKTVFGILTPFVGQRLALRSVNDKGKKPKKPIDCMQWLIDTSPRKTPWTVERTVHEIMAVWFGSMHQLIIATTYALYDLCLHQECVEPLRQELDEPQYREFEATAQGLPLLDSFIKESSRLSPSEATMTVSVRRKALKPFIFSNGLKVASGDWACAPMQAMNLDSKFYSDPQTFHGFRFAPTVPPAVNFDGTIILPGEQAKFTDTSDTWLLWGAGSKTCAGRYYATLVLKLILAHVLTNYDFELKDEGAARTRWWRTSITPLPTTAIVFRSRASI